MNWALKGDPSQDSVGILAKEMVNPWQSRCQVERQGKGWKGSWTGWLRSVIGVKGNLNNKWKGLHGPVVKTLTFQRRGCGLLIPGQEATSHMPCSPKARHKTNNRVTNSTKTVKLIHIEKPTRVANPACQSDALKPGHLHRGGFHRGLFLIHEATGTTEPGSF